MHIFMLLAIWTILTLRILPILSILLCLPLWTRLLPLPLRALLGTLWPRFMVAEAKIFRLCWVSGIAASDRSLKQWSNFNKNCHPREDYLLVFRSPPLEPPRSTPSTGEVLKKRVNQMDTDPGRPESASVPIVASPSENPAVMLEWPGGK